MGKRRIGRGKNANGREGEISDANASRDAKRVKAICPSLPTRSASQTKKFRESTNLVLLQPQAGAEHLRAGKRWEMGRSL
eukprot:6202618-Pleurochrysis_carterae.AAC.1